MVGDRGDRAAGRRAGARRRRSSEVAREQGMKTLREDGLAQGPGRRHLARRDPARRRLKTWQGRRRRSSTGPDRPILSRDRCPRVCGAPMREGSAGGDVRIPAGAERARGLRRRTRADGGDRESAAPGGPTPHVAEPACRASRTRSRAPVDDCGRPAGRLLAWSRRTSRRAPALADEPGVVRPAAGSRRAPLPRRRRRLPRRSRPPPPVAPPPLPASRVRTAPSCR